ncbi:MAG: hypothetical protein CL724_11660 [Chloroflexi bacterium]|nr:hypothetical protein [Chloroflexota bacterium]
MTTRPAVHPSASVQNFLTGDIIPCSLTPMRPDEPVRSLRLWSRPWQAASCAFGVTVALLLLAQAASSQSPAPTEQARVPTSYANVHAAPGSGSVPLVLVPRGTVLPIVGRRGEWVQVQLSPELKQTGMVMRWYEGAREIIRRGRRITIGDEDSGWMHDSTVELTEVTSP